MYLFSIQGKMQPGKAEEFAQKWKDFYGPLAKEMSGSIKPILQSIL